MTAAVLEKDLVRRAMSTSLIEQTKRIRRLVIGGYRNFRENTILEDLRDFNIVIGKNNVGKTNFLRYILRRVPQAREKITFIPVARIMYEPSEQEIPPKQITDNDVHSKGTTGGEPRIEQSQLIFNKYYKLQPEIRNKILDFLKEFTGAETRVDRDEETWQITLRYKFQGQELNADTLGTGPRSLFAMLVEIYYGNKEIVLIDEPELSFHPELQKKLFAILKQISHEKQIFVATHSHLFIDRENIDNNFVLEAINDITRIRRISNEKELKELVYEQLGNSPADLFFPNNFIIVEGPSDKDFVKGLMEKFYASQIEGKFIQVQYAEGNIENLQMERTLNAINKVYAPLRTGGVYKDKVVILIDGGQNEQEVLHFKKEYEFQNSDGRLKSLAEIGAVCIEEAYPKTVILRIMKKRNPSATEHELPTFIQKTREDSNGKCQLAREVVEEIQEHEIPPIFKEVIEKALQLSF